MAKSPQFNMRVPAPILVEFRGALDAVRDMGVAVDEQEAARAALLMFSRCHRKRVLAAIEDLRTYDITRAKGAAVFDAWERAVNAETIVNTLDKAMVDTRVLALADSVRDAALDRYEYLRTKYPQQADPFRGMSFDEAMRLPEEKRNDIMRRNVADRPHLEGMSADVRFSAEKLKKDLEEATQAVQRRSGAKRSGKRSASTGSK